jgi:hypothetical protein
MLGKDAASDDDVKQCYSDARWRPPKDIRQSLRDAKSKKGWVDNTDDGDWTLTYEGQNVVEHDLLQNQ